MATSAIAQRRELIHHVFRAHNVNGDKMRELLEALWEILEDAATNPAAGQIVITLDALDECVEAHRFNLSAKLRHCSPQATNEVS